MNKEVKTCVVMSDKSSLTSVVFIVIDEFIYFASVGDSSLRLSATARNTDMSFGQTLHAIHRVIDSSQQMALHLDLI